MLSYLFSDKYLLGILKTRQHIVYYQIRWWFNVVPKGNKIKDVSINSYIIRHNLAAEKQINRRK